MNPNKLGAKIKQRREEKKLSQKELAWIIGVTQVDVSRWESGKHEPTLGNIVKLCDELDFNLAEFIESR